MPEIHKLSISLSASEKMGKAAMVKAIDLVISIAVTIVDESGVTKYFARMDQKSGRLHRTAHICARCLAFLQGHRKTIHGIFQAHHV